MVKHIVAIILFLYGLTIYSQGAYLKTQFVKDKEVLKKEAYKDLEKCRFYKEMDSVRIAFIYCFNPHCSPLDQKTL
jgi:hypothetical protein